MILRSRAIPINTKLKKLMILMLVRFKLDGRTYSKNKEAFKQMLRKHGIFWKGTMQQPWWGSNTEKVIAEFERDQVREITVSATLIWEGESESAFLKDFRTWCIGLKAEETSMKVSELKGSADDLLFYDMIYKPQEAYLESSGRPKTWIERDLAKFEAEKSKKFGGKTAM